MAEVVLCASRENDATIRQLADAVARLGYSLWQDESPAPDPASFDKVSAEIGGAKAVIVIWSEAAAASDWVRAEANVAAGQKKLIQVSADGRAPPIPFDPAQMISILTWRGEDDHPGWRGVQAALATLCGPPSAPAAPIPATAPPPPSAPVAAPAPAPVQVPPPAPTQRGGSKAPLVLLLVGLIVVAAAAAYYWFYWRAPVPAAAATGNSMAAAPAPAPQFPTGFTPPPGAEADTPVPAPAAPAADPFDRQAVVQDPAGYAIVRSAPTELGLTVGRVNAGETVSTYAQSGDYWRVRTASGQTGYVEAASLRLSEAAATAAPPPPPSVPGQAAAPVRPVPRTAQPRQPRSRIVKENSSVMSAFCDNAGRGTPQCRAYRREGGR